MKGLNKIDHSNFGLIKSVLEIKVLPKKPSSGMKYTLFSLKLPVLRTAKACPIITGKISLPSSENF